MTVKYKFVAETLEKEIKSGLYSENNKIPTEEEIAKRFEISRNTVRKSIDILVKKGIVYQVQGSGAFIRKIENEDEKYINIQNMNGLTKDIPNANIETKVIDFKLIKADKYIAKKMNCEVGAEIYFVNRMRIIGNCPYSIEYSYFNKDIILYLNEDIIKNSIYSFIRNDLKLSIGLVDRIFYADMFSDTESEFLGLEKGTPALVNENIARLSTGEIFDYSRVMVNSKEFKFTYLANLK